MSRPVNKDELITLINSMPNEFKNKNYKIDTSNKKEAHWERDENIRDIFIHINEWHNLLLHWVKLNQNDIKTSFLPDPYNWRTYGEMNQIVWKKNKMFLMMSLLSIFKNHISKSCI